MSALAILIHVAVTLALPPLLLGIITRTKAVFAGRRGPPLLQPYHDIAKLLQKGTVLSRTTTWVFRAGPVVAVSTAFVASLLVPQGRGAPIAFTGDLLLFAYLFGLARFFTVSAALDTGSSFEGMGGAREATFACLAEPALILGLIAVVRRSGALSLSSMLGAGLTVEWSIAAASTVLVLASLFIVLLAEACRVPFDDPSTHLELTMIHEVMVLDHSGPSFGFILYGSAMKLFVLGALLVRVAIPASTGSLLGDWGVFGLAMIALAVIVGVVESVMARLRLTHVPGLLVAACLLSAFGVVLTAR